MSQRELAQLGVDILLKASGPCVRPCFDVPQMGLLEVPYVTP